MLGAVLADRNNRRPDRRRLLSARSPQHVFDVVVDIAQSCLLGLALEFPSVDRDDLGGWSVDKAGFVWFWPAAAGFARQAGSLLYFFGDAVQAGFFEPVDLVSQDPGGAWWVEAYVLTGFALGWLEADGCHQLVMTAAVKHDEEPLLGCGVLTMCVGWSSHWPRFSAETRIARRSPRRQSTQSRPGPSPRRLCRVWYTELPRYGEAKRRGTGAGTASLGRGNLDHR